MATATITGSLRTFGGANFNYLDPVIIFRPNGAGLGTGGNVFSGPDVRVLPDVGGAFSQDLEVTDRMLNADAHYDVLIEWREPGITGQPGGVAMHDTGWKVRVPAVGGNFGELATRSPNHSMVIISPTQPHKHFGAGTLWLQQDPTDPGNSANPANTSRLYRLQ